MIRPKWDQIMFPHMGFRDQEKFPHRLLQAPLNHADLPCPYGFQISYRRQVTWRDAVTGNCSTYWPDWQDQEIIPLMINPCCGMILAVISRRREARQWGDRDIHRKLLHADNGLIRKEIIHRKRLYIRHEKDPHPTGRISTSRRKYLHNTRCNLMIIKSKNRL